MADINIFYHNPDDEWRFRSQYWVHTPVANDRHLITLTGMVVPRGPDEATEPWYKGITSDQWRRDTFHLELPFPTDFFPFNNLLKLEQWAPFVTINAIYDEAAAVNAGWTVDDFGVSLPDSREIYSSIQIWASVAIRDSDAYLYRIAYNLTVVGKFHQ